MIWLLFAFLTALSESLKDVFSKISLKTTQPLTAAFALRLFALPFLIPLLIFIEIPQIGKGYWPALFIGGGMNILITILYMKAIKQSELSVTVPMVTFTPLFLLLTAPLILGEIPGKWGIAGVLCIVAGAYILNITRDNKGFFGPFKAMKASKGPRLMLLVAFLWSISANFDKIGIQNSSAMFWAVTVSIFLCLGMLPLMWLKSNPVRAWNEVKANYKGLIVAGMFAAFTLIFQMLAVELTLVAYVIAIKRTSALLAVLFGALIFREKGLRHKLPAVLLMLLGVMLISLF